MTLTPEQMATGRRSFLKTIAGVPAVAALGAASMAKGPVGGGHVRVGFIGVGGQVARSSAASITTLLR
jgi:hypothetical protein